MLEAFTKRQDCVARKHATASSCTLDARREKQSRRLEGVLRELQAVAELNELE